MQIWDIYTRVFHWLLAISMITTIIIADISTHWHFETAKFITTLIIFRIIWGFIGYKTARFSNFLPTPNKIKSYFQGNFNKAGHNPIGALSIFAMLGIIILQISTGLFTTDEILFEAPLYHLVSSEIQEILQELHDEASNIIIAIIILHIVAIIIYKLRGKNLVKDMVVGGETNEHLAVKNIHLRALISITTSLIITYFIFY